MIELCDVCHDEVEITTHKLFKRNKIFSVDTLRTFIKGEFPTYAIA